MQSPSTNYHNLRILPMRRFYVLRKILKQTRKYTAINFKCDILNSIWTKKHFFFSERYLTRECMTRLRYKLTTREGEPSIVSVWLLWNPTILHSFVSRFSNPQYLPTFYRDNVRLASFSRIAGLRDRFRWPPSYNIDKYTVGIHR